MERQQQVELRSKARQVRETSVVGKRTGAGNRDSHPHLQVQVHGSGKNPGTVDAATAIDGTKRSLANQQNKES